jgi:hypothetical protein
MKQYPQAENDEKETELTALTSQEEFTMTDTAHGPLSGPVKELDMLVINKTSDPPDKAGDNVTKEPFVREYKTELCKLENIQLYPQNAAKSDETDDSGSKITVDMIVTSEDPNGSLDDDRKEDDRSWRTS